VGNGEYRVPTIRESACLMGFPITYQFLGSESVKCKLVGNAVCPSVSRAFAKQTRKIIGLKVVKDLVLNRTPDVDGVNNLNTFTERIFETPPKRNKGSRFRRHPFKHGNITVTLSNYNVLKNEKRVSKWRTSVQYGNGEGYPVHNLPDGFYNELEHLIQKIDKGNEFLQVVNNGFTDKIGNGTSLQEMYETQQSEGVLLEPTERVVEVGRFIELLGVDKRDFTQEELTIFKYKKQVPVSQLFALYALNKISTIANEN
jgi:DNA (cytosine-5)-methyltransferase 1